MENLSNTLHSLLAHNIVYFTFRKVNGEIRHAVGTRNLTLAEIHTGTSIPTPKGAEQPYSYYDVEKMGWRSYKPENIISIDRVNDFDYATSEPIKQAKKGELPNDAPTESEIEIDLPFGNTPEGGAKFVPKNAPERSFKVEGIDIDTLADLIAKKVVERLFSGDVKRVIIERD